MMFYKNYNNLYFTISIIATMFLSSTISASMNTTYEPFRGQDENSSLSINYADYSMLLSKSVIDLGMSNREKAPKVRAKIGSLVKPKRKVNTGLEGNRFQYELFNNKNNVLLLTNMRKSLENVPEEISMSMLNSKEQLAYWLNLYNISLIEQLVTLYPRRNIESELYGSNGILDKKVLKVSGIDLSLNDIHQNIIIAKFGMNPIVMYGLFQGTIGGPNIRNKAYTGKLVMSQLTNNATQFINSNRGTYQGMKKTFRVSTFYNRNNLLFPDFKNDLRNHINAYLNDDYKQKLESSNRRRVNIKNNSIADLKGGQRRLSQASSSNAAILLGALASGATSGAAGQHATGNIDFLVSNMAENVSTSTYSRFSPDTVKMLAKIRQKSNENKGTVIIEEQSSN